MIEVHIFLLILYFLGQTKTIVQEILLNQAVENIHVDEFTVSSNSWCYLISNNITVII